MSARPVLHRGSYGQDVADWQKGIGITADGIFGAQTESATRRWQADHDLEPDGVVGPLSWASLPRPRTTLPGPAPDVSERSERLVPTTRTTLDMAAFATALRTVWPEANRKQAGVLWAHFAGETGDGRSCWNFNLGNVKHVKGDGHAYVSLLGVWEGFAVHDEDRDGDIDDADRVMLVERLCRSGAWAPDPSVDHAKAVGPGKVSLIATAANAATLFVAHGSLEDGMRAFVEMKRDPRSRYSGAWRYVLAGDPEGYAYLLGQRGYYTASPAVYAAAMRRKFDAWLKNAPAFDVG